MLYFCANIFYYLNRMTLLTALTILFQIFQTGNQDVFEVEICQCIYDKYDSIGIDLKSGLLKYEQYLVDHNFLSDTTGQSYIQVFRTIIRENDIPSIQENNMPTSTNYPDNIFTQETSVLFSKCFYSKRGDSNLERSNSKIKELYSAFDNISASAFISPSKVSDALLTVLDAKDFSKEIYKMYALHTFYMTARPAINFLEHKK